MPNLYDGFWFPSSIRNRIIKPNTPYDLLHFSEGAIVPAAGPDTVTVRWPRLELADWKQVVAQLWSNRRHARHQDWDGRLPRAVQRLRDTWLNQANPLRRQVLQALARCTGHSAEMLDLALGFLDLISVDDLQRAGDCQFKQAVRGQFMPMDGLPGRIRFFDTNWWQRQEVRALLHFDGYRDRPWSLRFRRTDLIVGYAAGNVPGTGLLLILLGLAAAIQREEAPPIILVKNSSREPLFTPLVLTVLEMIDPELLNTTLVTMWDYTDHSLQDYLIGQADLVVAAASDETIDTIDRTVKRVSAPSRPVRFHRHGHKVSFTTVGRECLARETPGPAPGVLLIDAVALCAGLDVALWNQQGCLSSRIHFVEQGNSSEFYPVEEYGRAVVDSLRTVNDLIPKGLPRRRQIHNLFDKYQAIAAGGQLQVLSAYDDDFLAVLDRRPLAAQQFRETVNDCHDRTVAIVPVDDVMHISSRYLRHLNREHLQSMGVAVGDPNTPGLDPRLLRYAGTLGAAGVTGIRTVGRAAFPQLGLSWDGLIPRDLTVSRPRGYFTAIEFDDPWAQIWETFALVQEALSQRSPAQADHLTGLVR